ncbi:MAG: hemerythrin domain-containing protein, partial [Planctomycetota bacterium]
LCLLKDIVQIHNLPQDQEQQLMARIAQEIYPDKRIDIPGIKRKIDAQTQQIRYSPPMKKLVEEHVLIKRWAALIPEVVRAIDLKTEGGRQVIRDGIDFIRSYADRYHHAKEEDILFKYFNESTDILKVMHEDHKQARSHVKSMLEALEKQDEATLAEHLNAYQDLLIEHIRKEDEILYPWMDNNLSMRQIGELFSKFDAADQQLGFSPVKYEAFIKELEDKFRLKEY